MSFYRFIYYCAFLGGWCAFIGWLIPELTIPGSMKGTLQHDLIAAAFVGAGIGAGVMGLSGNGKSQKITRALIGFGGGLVAGALGGLMGNILVDKAHLPRSIGWMVMGLCIGSIEGVYEWSSKKLRNGLIGGALGGLLGGMLFEPIARAIGDAGSGKNLLFTSRSVGFVILGLAIGSLIGLVQVVLRQAWLTVIDGYRPGRQVILSQPVTLLGRGEWVALPFMGSFGNALDMEHLRIVRQSDGSYRAEDNDTKNGSEINRQRINGPVSLRDGDTIKIGNNIVRFNEKSKKESGERERREPEPTARPATRSGIAPAPPPPAPVARSEFRPPPPPPPSANQETKLPPAPPLPSTKADVKPPPPPSAKPEVKMPPPPPSAKPEVKAPPPPAPTPKPDVKAPAPPPPAPSAAGDDACPSCKRKVPGKKGMRYCMVCDMNF